MLQAAAGIAGEWCGDDASCAIGPGMPPRSRAASVTFGLILRET